MRYKYIYNFHSVWAAKYFASFFKTHDITSEGGNVYCNIRHTEFDNYAIKLKGSLYKLKEEGYSRIF